MHAYQAPKRRSRVLLGALASAAALCCAIPPAQAEGPLENAPPILNETLWREGRFELVPKFGFTIGDTFEHNLLPGLTFNYYPLDWLAVGVDVSYGLSVDTDLHSRVNDELILKQAFVCQGVTGADCDDRLSQTNLAAGKIGTTSIQALTTLQLSFVPIRGKMMWFDSLLVHYDMAIVLGGVAGFMRGEDGMDDDIAFGPSIGLVTRFLFTDWIGFHIDVRDFLLQYHEATDQSGSKLPSEFHNHVQFSVGLSLNFPTEPRVQALE